MKLPKSIVEQDGIFILIEEDADAEKLMDAAHWRVPGEKRWVRRKGIVEQAASFVKAIASKEVNAEQYAHRRAICYAPCPALQGDHCTVCG